MMKRNHREKMNIVPVALQSVIHISDSDGISSVAGSLDSISKSGKRSGLDFAVRDPSDVREIVNVIMNTTNALEGCAARGILPDKADDDDVEMPDILTAICTLRRTIAEIRECDVMSERVWEKLKEELCETIEIVRHQTSKLDHLMKECEPQRAQALVGMVRLEKALLFSEGMYVEVEYDDKWYMGQVTSVENTFSGEIAVRYFESGEQGDQVLGEPFDEEVSEGHIRPPSLKTTDPKILQYIFGASENVSGRHASGQEKIVVIPFHMAGVCSTTNPVKVLEKVEQIVMEMEIVYRNVVVRDPKSAMIRMLNCTTQLTKELMHLRGLLTGVWPTPPLAQGQRVRVRRAGAEAKDSADGKVLEVLKKNDNGKVYAKVVWTSSKGSVRESIVRGAWANRIQLQEWPGALQDETNSGADGDCVRVKRGRHA